MNRKLFLPLLLVSIISMAFVSIAYDDPFDDLMKKMQDYNQKYAQEKVHLHLDKPYYAVGDNIWFKAYIMNAATMTPSDISKILYVELINEKDSVKKRLRLAFNGGFGWGDFKLPDTLREGNYRIRAYTQWMRNAGPEFFYDKTIKVGNSWSNKVFTNADYTYSKDGAKDKVSAKVAFMDDKGDALANREISYEVQLGFKPVAKGKATTNAQGEVSLDFVNNMPATNKSGKIVAVIQMPDKEKVIKEIPIKATSNDVDVQFFPESGHLVMGLPNRVGFKAVSPSGLGVAVTGTIHDQQGTEINTFTAGPLGMDNFVLNPQPGNIYTATVKFPDGSSKKIDLPKVENSGYIMNVSNVDTAKIMVKVMMSEDLVGPKNLKLVAQHGGTVYLASNATSDKQVIVIPLLKKELPSGIIQLSLFSSDNQPIAERLVFVNHVNDKIDAKIESAKSSYGKREKVTLNLSAAIAGKPVQGTFSVAVTNTASVKPDLENESNIMTSMLLSSDLVGYIEKPNHYFLDNNPKTLEDLDNLLLTQGWRRFIWKNIISNAAPIIRFQPEKSIAISGTITTYGGKPVPNGKVSLFSSSGGLFAIDTLTNAEGRFNFDQLIFGDDTKFIVQARNEKGKKSVDIKLDQVPGQIVTTNKNTGDIEINVNEALSAYLTKSANFFDEMAKRGLLERSLMLDEVKIVEKKNPAKNSSNMNGPGNADAVITADQLNTCINLSQCLQGRVAGLIITNGQAFLTRNGGRIPMQIFLDGMNIGSEGLDNIVPNDVETIEVLKSISYTTIYGSNGAGGVLVITTKRGGGYANMDRFVPGIITHNPQGYYLAREFYSPAYDENPNAAADLRSTVYWNPNLVTSTDGKIPFSFFNTDEAGSYRVVVEGIDMQGHLARTTYNYEVK